MFKMSVKYMSVFALLLLVCFLTLAGPNVAKAEVTNRLLVINNTNGPIDFYINGTLWITQIPGKNSRDCYPSHYGVKGDLQLKAVDRNGNVIRQFTQRGRANNFTWNVNP